MDQPKWSPSAEVIAAANLTGAIEERGLADYDAFYEWSHTDRSGFWGYTANRLGIRMAESADAVLGVGTTPEHPIWFPGARLNIAESCFAAPPQKVAVRYQISGHIHDMTYGELRRMANRVANGLASCGVAVGDRVAIAMPMNIEAVVSYLGIVLAGAVVVSIADSFATHEIATRMRISGARIAITQDVINRGGKTLPMFAKLVAAGVEQAIVVETGGNAELRDDDIAWSAFLSTDDEFAAVDRDPGDHANILFSSGTTGDPKAIPWTHVSPIKTASDAHYHHDVHPSDVVAWPTNLGWMMGPWLIFSSLVNRATMAISDEIPTGPGFTRFVEESGVTVLGLVPSLVSAWRAGRAAESCDWSKIRLFSSTGEASNADDMAYLMDLAGNKPIIDYIGGTELAGGYMAGTVLHPCIPATFTTPTLGGAIHLIDDEGNPSSSGELFIEPPALGLSLELLNKDHHEVYYAGCPDIGLVLRRHGDRIELLDNGHYRAQGRTDDAMNLGGIKVGSAEIEHVALGVVGLREAAAIAIDPPGGGPSKLVLYVVVEPGVDESGLMGEIQRRIRSELNPLFKMSDLVVVDSLPRTASAKVMRRSLRTDYLARPE
ncbi:MAG: AMP-binding protein [bacterium]|nr:AMP-binding protein [bacterium]